VSWKLERTLNAIFMVDNSEGRSRTHTTTTAKMIDRGDNSISSLLLTWAAQAIHQRHYDYRELTMAGVHWSCPSEHRVRHESHNSDSDVSMSSSLVSSTTILKFNMQVGASPYLNAIVANRTGSTDTVDAVVRAPGGHGLKGGEGARCVLCCGVSVCWRKGKLCGRNRISGHIALRIGVRGRRPTVTYCPDGERQCYHANPSHTCSVWKEKGEGGEARARYFNVHKISQEFWDRHESSDDSL
jgi:hypothetical protein